MILTILTTSYKRPKLLKRLSDVVIPLINKLNAKLRWKIIIDENTKEYDSIFEEITQKLKNKSLISWDYQTNTGKFKALVKLLDNNLDSNWLVNIDDDDLLINYKFENFLNQLNFVDKNVNAVLVPRLILNIKFYNFKFKMKKKLFSKFNNQILSYFDFKEKFGDIDSTIFIRSSSYQINKFPEIQNDNFTAESLLWLKTFPKKDILIQNEFLIYSQYLSGGLTKSINIKRTLNAKSAIAIYQNFLEYKKFTLSKFLLKSLINYYRFNLHAKNKINIFKKQYTNIFIQFICVIFAKLIFYYDNLFNKGKF